MTLVCFFHNFFKCQVIKVECWHFLAKDLLVVCFVCHRLVFSELTYIVMDVSTKSRKFYKELRVLLILFTMFKYMNFYTCLMSSCIFCVYDLSCYNFVCFKGYVVFLVLLLTWVSWCLSFVGEIFNFLYHIMLAWNDFWLCTACGSVCYSL